MANDEAVRKELGDFLRGRRNAANRSDHDLPALGRGRTTGLRREEIAFLSGVSVTWYTWLEQGRDINPSRQVIDAVAVNLRLTEAEHDYVLGLVGLAPTPRPQLAAPAPVPPHVQHLLEALAPSPAFALTTHWDIAAWNRPYEGLFPGVRDAEPTQRNLLQLVFTDPTVRAMLPDWEHTSRQFLAEYRSEAAARRGGAEHARLVRHLRSLSPAFSEAWDEHAIERFGTRARSFSHPRAGELCFEQVNLVPQDSPDLRVIAYLPLTDDGTRERLPLLSEGEAGNAPAAS